MTTSGGDEDWNKWNQRYPHKLRAIPMIFVLRSDGELLYSDSGSLTGQSLPTMLTTVLRRSGKQFNESQSQLLSKQVAVAEEALELEDWVSIASALAPVSQFWLPEKHGSYAEQCLKADEIFKRAADAAVREVHSSCDAAKSSANPFDLVLKIVETRAAFESFVETRKAIDPVFLEIKKDDKLQPLIKPCELLVTARRSASAENPRTRRRAESGYSAVIRKYPDSPAERLARAELRELNPGAEALQSPSEAPKPSNKRLPRLWSSREGGYSVTAQLVSIQQDAAVLRKTDGQIVKVPLEKLSEKDLEYLKSLE